MSILGVFLSAPWSLVENNILSEINLMQALDGYWLFFVLVSLQRMTSTGYSSVKPDIDAADVSKNNIKLSDKEELAQSSNLVFGYLNLFSDGVVSMHAF